MEFLQVGNLLDRGGTRTPVSPLGVQLNQASLRRAAGGNRSKHMLRPNSGLHCYFMPEEKKQMHLIFLKKRKYQIIKFLLRECPINMFLLYIF